MPEVRWSEAALGDLDAIGEYFERTSRQYARSIVASLYAAPEVLTEHPNLGRVVPEVEVEHVREIIREGYRIVYIASDDWVEVLAVLHGRQDLGRKLRRE
ncbi:MAG: type II toxin-antitoxin system RelE/ParE family toxin [Bacteroidota bacterium]